MDTRIYKKTCIQGYTRIHVFKDIQEYMDTRTYKNTGIQEYTRIHGYKDIQEYMHTRIIQKVNRILKLYVQKYARPISFVDSNI